MKRHCSLECRFRNGWLNGNCRWKTSPAEKRTCRLLPSSRLWKIKSRWGQCFDGWFPNRAWRKERLSGWKVVGCPPTKFQHKPTCVCCMHSGRASAKETGKCWHATMQRVYSINSTWWMWPVNSINSALTSRKCCRQMPRWCSVSITGCFVHRLRSWTEGTSRQTSRPHSTCCAKDCWLICMNARAVLAWMCIVTRLYGGVAPYA